MELLHLFGFVFEDEVTIKSFALKIKGLVILYILFSVLVAYQFLSFFCTVWSPLFPESTNNVKRSAISSFWKLCQYFMVSIRIPLSQKNKSTNKYKTLNKVCFQIEGDEIDSESAVIISNHRSLVDHIVMSYVANQSNGYRNQRKQLNSKELLTLPQVNFFSWFLVWRLPTIRILLNLAKCDENWELDKHLTSVLFDKVFKSKKPEWVVIFPEVNVWTEEDSFIQKRQSEKYFLPILSNVLYPRFFGFENFMNALNTGGNFKFSKLYDVTLNYEREIACPILNASTSRTYIQTPLSLTEAFASQDTITIRIRIKSKSIARIPTKTGRLEKWLEKAWVDKDNLLAEIKERKYENKNKVEDLTEKDSLCQ